MITDTGLISGGALKWALQQAYFYMLIIYAVFTGLVISEGSGKLLAMPAKFG
jgi:hypothetical protein